MVAVAIRVSVMVTDSHLVQPVVAWGRRGSVRKAVGLIRKSIGGAETLTRANGAWSLAWMLLVRRFPLKAVLFGSGRRKGMGALSITEA